jgi:uncharacterized protein with ATP-grasp and redox domains
MLLENEAAVSLQPHFLFLAGAPVIIPFMRTYLDCFPCIIRQSLEAARMAGASEAQQRDIVLSAMQILSEVPAEATPPEISFKVHQMVRTLTGHDDPYRKVKQGATQKALAMLPKLQTLVEESADPLDTAIRLSVAGNIIDFGPNPSYDLWEEVESALSRELAIDDTVLLRDCLAEAENVLYLADNAGETVFDRLLIEALGKPVTYAVRGGPVLNDATMEDALAAGINAIAEVIDNGARAAGTILSQCSPDFVDRFMKSDLILSKGMGNYETLSNVNAPIFFLMKVKCPIIGQHVGAPVGSAIVKRV